MGRLFTGQRISHEESASRYLFGLAAAVKGFILAVFAAAALASGWLPKGLSQSRTAVPTQQVAQQVFPGVEPISAWQCPSTHIIKGNFTPSSGERCIFHVPGGAFYDNTKPEKCYVSHQDAIADGCRQSRR
jgi:hypothetical protein